MIFFSFVIWFQPKKSSSNPIPNPIAYAIPAVTYKITDNSKISVIPASIPFKTKILGALSVGDGQKRPIPSLLPSQNHYLESY
ncbi:MAG TPA: hypothetical protein VLP30_08145, partial [Desulfatirhabdiaceae bacterium]|nr:hypothetical protein [Desulfatirhabdiaceae bacterium]